MKWIIPFNNAEVIDGVILQEVPQVKHTPEPDFDLQSNEPDYTYGHATAVSRMTPHEKLQSAHSWKKTIKRMKFFRAVLVFDFVVIFPVVIWRTVAAMHAIATGTWIDVLWGVIAWAVFAKLLFVGMSNGGADSFTE